MVWKEGSKDYRQGPRKTLGPIAMLGYARQFNPDLSDSTDEILKELRERE